MSNNHIGETRNLHMIDVSSKEVTTRAAEASGTITLNNEAFSSIVDLNNKKGDVLNAARLAGINAAKQTSNLIPLAHNISLNSVDINFEFDKDIFLVGVGGVFSKEDYENKIKLGASLVQIYTGFIFEGPAIVKKILSR